ncbi:unnamed protein product [Gongylonema pulchrum]|uniref:Uncharacterized protein n=1 Tax=Gongylonema pulchrum TaxID=637853 RepID=A0A3P6PMA1_9BILA|nr:unnamed protein product [Gongylonema pulchrum]
MAEITFKTDLENCDYQQEHGATRLFEAFKLYQQEEKAKETKEEEEKKDPMKMLEKRTKMSRLEMEALGKLEELQETNRRHEAFGPDQYFQSEAEALAEAYRRQEQEDEQFVRKLYGRTEDGKIIKRIIDDEEDVKPDLGMQVKQEFVEDDQKPGCSFVDLKAISLDSKSDIKTSSAVTANKRMTQREILAKAVMVKKPKSEQLVTVKTETVDPDDSTPVRLPNQSDPKKPDQQQSSSASLSVATKLPPVISPPAEAAPASTSSALQGLADYGSDSNSD